ncbi:MAG: 50S ribosomal protein L1 [Candidatus Bathyarchaeota archaeon]|jgi:large subunit ribosomal protein L1|nr:50S ribosomal protein L1 [Candidatus Bathyarchaeota archaeon]
MPLNMKNILAAVKEVKSKATERKFSQSIDLAINLQNIDMKKPEGRIQERIELPNSVGKELKICVIASGEMALKAKKAGASLVVERAALESLVGDKKKQKDLAKNYDLFIAEAPLMPLVGRSLGASLGPRGKMPTPVPPNADIKEQIKRHRKLVFVRMRGQPVLQCRVGNEDMADKEIAENVQAIVRRIEGKLKRGIKNVKSIYLKTSMGSAVKVAM